VQLQKTFVDLVNDVEGVEFSFEILMVLRDFGNNGVSRILEVHHFIDLAVGALVDIADKKVSVSYNLTQEIILDVLHHIITYFKAHFWFDDLVRTKFLPFFPILIQCLQSQVNVAVLRELRGRCC
jgi:hypothetical protein